MYERIIQPDNCAHLHYRNSNQATHHRWWVITGQEFNNLFCACFISDKTSRDRRIKTDAFRVGHF